MRILADTVASFRKRMALAISTPFCEATRLAAATPVVSVPPADSSFRKEDVFKIEKEIALTSDEAGSTMSVEDAMRRGQSPWTDPAGIIGADARMIFDVGANVGQTTLHLADVFPGAAIYAFEPGYDYAQWLAGLARP